MKSNKVFEATKPEVKVYFDYEIYLEFKAKVKNIE